MTRCVTCKASELREAREPDVFRFTLASGEKLEFHFDAVPQLVCGSCGERYFDGPTVHAEELAVSRELIARQIRDPAVFKWLRKMANLTAAELAELLDVTPETISHWENGHSAPSRATWAILDALVEDASEDRTTTLDRLRANSEARIPKRPVRLSLKTA
jgi:DNA-binding transcriptional regulator YiaG